MASPITLSVGEELPNVHCLVHPGFDEGEHEEFEKNLHEYIEYIARETNDILLIVSDGESFDIEQIQKFALLDIIQAISMYIGLHDGGLGDMIEVYDSKGNYSPIIAREGLSEKFYKWCQANIEMSELDSIANEWRALKNDYFSGKYTGNEQEHDNQAALLRDKEETARIDLDIVSLSERVLDEFGPVRKRSMTHRNINNRGRFFRIFQHALKSLGKERVREIFIRDDEDVEVLPILPISHFHVFQGDIIPTPSASNQEGQCQTFNASESFEFGNAATLRDKITYELSVTRHEKLVQQQPKEIFKDMGVEITSKTKFVFLGEYRNRCVNNVFRVMNYRMSSVTGDKFYIANDAFTLERPANHVGTNWF